MSFRLWKQFASNAQEKFVKCPPARFGQQRRTETRMWLAFVYRDSPLALSHSIFMNENARFEMTSRSVLRLISSSCVISTIIQWTHKIEWDVFFSITD